jgi:hypothetical protein
MADQAVLPDSKCIQEECAHVRTRRTVSLCVHVHSNHVQTANVFSGCSHYVLDVLSQASPTRRAQVGSKINSSAIKKAGAPWRKIEHTRVLINGHSKSFFTHLLHTPILCLHLHTVHPIFANLAYIPHSYCFYFPAPCDVYPL